MRDEIRDHAQRLAADNGLEIDPISKKNFRMDERVKEILQQRVGIRAVEKVARPAREHGRCYPGFNLFHGDDLDLFLTLARGEFAISGLRNRHLQPALGKTGSQISRRLKRLRLHGLIKKVRRTYTYYLTRLGQRVVACTLRLRETVALPALAGATSV